jgi:hypothetical protein
MRKEAEGARAEEKRRRRRGAAEESGEKRKETVELWRRGGRGIGNELDRLFGKEDTIFRAAARTVSGL